MFNPYKDIGEGIFRNIPRIDDKAGAKIKAYIKNNETGVILLFQYNPGTVKSKKSVNYSEITSPGGSSVQYQFAGAGKHTFPIDLYMSGSPEKIKGWIAWLNDFLPYYHMGHLTMKPPTLTFAYGWFVKVAILTDLDIEYTMFDEDLQPIEAKIKLSLSGVNN